MAPLDGSTLFFSNEQPGYGTGVAYDHGTYKTLAVSFEFGGLADGDYSKNDLMGDIRWMRGHRCQAFLREVEVIANRDDNTDFR